MARQPADTSKGFASAARPTGRAPVRELADDEPTFIADEQTRSERPPPKAERTPPKKSQPPPFRPPPPRQTAKQGVPAAPLTPNPPSLPKQPAPRERSAAIQVISMKTPAELEAEHARVPAVEGKRMQVQLRSLAEISAKQPSLGGRMGNLAPPRDLADARDRRVRSNVQWAAIALGVAAIVASLVWLVAHAR